MEPAASREEAVHSDRDGGGAGDHGVCGGGELVNMLLYCTYDFIFLFFLNKKNIFSRSLFGVSNKNWQLHVLFSIQNSRG